MPAVSPARKIQRTAITEAPIIVIADIRSAAVAAVGRLITVTCDCLSLP